MRRLGFIAVLCVVSIGFAAIGAEEHSSTLMGYSAQGSQTERQWEKKFQAIPEPDNMRAYTKHLSAYPHHVGSPYDKANAEWILSKFRQFGLDAYIETFYVLRILSQHCASPPFRSIPFPTSIPCSFPLTMPTRLTVT